MTQVSLSSSNFSKLLIVLDIHNVRPHKGQMAVAKRLRALSHSSHNPSEIAESHRNCGKVQDAYTLRCVPQVSFCISKHNFNAIV